MKTNNLIFVSLLSALFITAGAFAPGYAVGKKSAHQGAHWR
jgi:hypothetical protein